MNKKREIVIINKNQFIRDMDFLIINGRKTTDCTLEYFCTDIDLDIVYFRFFLECFEKTLNCNSLADIDNTLNLTFLVEIFSKKNIYGGEIVMEYIKNAYDLLENTDSPTSESLLTVLFEHDEFYDLYANKMLECDDDDYVQKLINKNLSIVMQYIYIKALIKSIFISNHYSKSLSLNDEILVMYNNLRDSEIDISESINELYPIYEIYYQDVFREKLSPHQLSATLYLTNGFIDIYDYDEFYNLANSMVNKYGESFNYNNMLTIFFDYCMQMSVKEEGEYNSMLYCFLSRGLLERCPDSFELSDIFYIVMTRPYLFKLYELEYKKNRLLDNTISSRIIDDKDSFNDVYSGEDFEEYLGKLYSDLGYEVFTTKTTGDQGADLILKKGGISISVQAKFYSGPVGNKAVQEVIGSIGFYNADKGIVITNSTFTKSAIELAIANNIELIDGESLNVLRKCAYGY